MTANPIYGSNSSLCILSLFFLHISSMASVSPGHLGLSSSSNAMIPPLGILGKKLSKATLVGSKRSKSKKVGLQLNGYFFLRI